MSNKKNSILIATNLKIWSIEKNKGAISFYKTLEYYNSKNYTIFLLTTENCEVPELKNIKIIRLYKLRDINIKYLYTIKRNINYILNQLIFLFVFIKNVKNINPNLLYAYEIEFVPGIHIVSRIFNIPYVSRFQGTILWPKMKNRYWKIKFFPHYFSIKQESDYTIMTDDGTKGLDVIKQIRKKTNNIDFLKNGLSKENYIEKNISEKIKLLAETNTSYDKNFITVSRLKKWKRVDRSIDVYSLFENKSSQSSRLLIVGDGEDIQYLKNYSKKKKIKNIHFTGGLNSDEVKYLLSHSNIFLSHYELSNVGNPLWEAIQYKCLVVTISNGSTGDIIKDYYSGIISDEDEFLKNAIKLLNLSSNEINDMIENSYKEISAKLLSWPERMSIEHEKIYKLLNSNL